MRELEIGESVDLTNPRVMESMDVPDPIKQFVVAMKEFCQENDFYCHPENFTIAYLRELQEKAKTFGVILHDDGVLEVAKQS